MTNKDYSRELCEICGIERKGKLIFKKRNWDGKSWVSAGCSYKKFDFSSIPDVSVDIIPTAQWDKKNGFQYPYKYLENIKKLYDKHGYDFVEFEKADINFEQPENFVKLIELRFTTKRGDIFTVVEALQNARSFTFADRKSFLEQLLDYIFVCENFGEYIKQAIREQEWKYE